VPIQGASIEINHDTINVNLTTTSYWLKSEIRSSKFETNLHHRDVEFAKGYPFSFLCVFRASALKVVADPSFDGSAVILQFSLLHTLAA
jgi:hypothetical protein